jgi:hypothetical protein
MARVPEGYLTMKEVMQRAGVRSCNQIRKDIDAGILPLHRIPSQKKLFLFKEEEAETYVQEYHMPRPDPPKKCG